MPRHAAAASRHACYDCSYTNCRFAGLSGHERRFVPFNGGFGGAQRAWLRGALAAARAARERVVVLSHVALHPAACDGTTMAWDYDAVLGLLAEVRVMCVTSCV